MQELRYFYEKSLEEIENIIKIHNIDLNTFCDNSFCVIHRVYRYEDPKIINLLIKYGADINIKSKYGTTAIFYAAQNLKYNHCKILLENGADINISNYNNDTALEYFISKINYSSYIDMHTSKILEIGKLFIDYGVFVDDINDINEEYRYIFDRSTYNCKKTFTV